MKPRPFDSGGTLQPGLIVVRNDGADPEKLLRIGPPPKP